MGAKAESLATKGSADRSKMSKKMRDLFVQSKKASKKSSDSKTSTEETEKKTSTTVAPASTSTSGNAARKLQVQDDTFNVNMNVTRPARMTVDQADAQIAALNLMAMSQSSNAADYNSMLNTNYNSETQSTTQTNSNTDSSTSSNTDSASKTTSADDTSTSTSDSESTSASGEGSSEESKSADDSDSEEDKDGKSGKKRGNSSSAVSQGANVLLVSLVSVMYALYSAQ